MTRSLQLAALLVALAAVLIGSLGSQRREREAALEALPSATSTGRHGLAAARQFLERTGRPSRILSSSDDRPAPGEVWLLAAPGEALDEEEADAVVAHAARGGTVAWLPGPWAQPALTRRFAAAAPVLEGRLLMLDRLERLDNAHLGDGENLGLLVGLSRRGPIAFDERHLRPSGRVELPAGSLWLLALQLGLWTLLLFAALAPRFGAIRPPPPQGATRTARDYLASLAELYRRAGAEEELAATSWRRLQRRLQRRATRSPDAAAALAAGEAALAEGGPGQLRRVTRAVAEVERVLSSTHGR